MLARDLRVRRPFHVCSKHSMKSRLTVSEPRSARNASRGLTLIELLFVITIVGILAAIAVPAYNSHFYKVQVEQATTDIQSLAAKIDLYYTDAGQYPATLADVGCSATTCVDPWGNPYAYINHALLNGNGHVRRDRSLNPLNSDYDVYSIGKDGLTAFPITQSASLDDVIRAGSGGYYGLASAF
jgi:general secretion pathway protein G